MRQIQTKKIPGYPRQSLSRCGRLFWTSSGEEIETFIGRNGYRQAYIYRGKKRLYHPKMIYRLMALTYLPPRPSKKHVVRHLDGDCNNNSADNLAWGTQKQNMADLKKHKKTRTKLTDDLKKIIIDELKSGASREELYKTHKVSFLTINRLYWMVEDGKKA